MSNRLPGHSGPCLDHTWTRVKATGGRHNEAPQTGDLKQQKSNPDPTVLEAGSWESRCDRALLPGGDGLRGGPFPPLPASGGGERPPSVSLGLWMHCSISPLLSRGPSRCVCVQISLFLSNTPP